VEPTLEESYLRRIADLEKQNAELRAENAELMAQVAMLTEQVTMLTEQVTMLTEQVTMLTEQVAKLTEQVARLSKNSSNSSKPPSSDIVKPPKPDSPKGPRRQGGQHGHPGASRPPFRPDQIDHVEPLRPPACPNGHQGTMEPVGEPRIHQVAELRDDPLKITEYHLQGCRCSICGQTVWPQLPPGVVEGQLFGPRLQTLIAYMKGALHASYTGLEELCRDVLDIDVSRSHLCNSIARVSKALAAPYEELAEHVPTEPVLNIDESGWKDKGLPYWIWVFCTSAISFFCIAKSRGSKVLEEILGKTYGGTIISDFFSAYVKYANRLQQFCLAHLIRDIKFLITLPGDADKRFGQRLLAEFKRLFHLWHLREKVPKDRFDKVMFRIKDRVLRQAAGCAEGEPSRSRTLARRVVKHGEAIFRFMFDAAVEPTNNAAERGIRTAVIDRRITQGSRSLMGRQWNERIWTVLGTCRKQGRSAWRFLQDAVLAFHGQSPAPSLLPRAT
jgi:transposase